MKQEEWKRYYRQAIHTLESARRDCEEGDYDWSCFKSQQAAELLLKGYIRSSIEFATGHSVLKLLDLLNQKEVVPENIRKCARNLDKVYIPTRYPDAYDAGSPMDYFDRSDAVAHIACVEEIEKYLRGMIADG